MIRKAERADGAVLAELAINMWDSHTLDELREEFEELSACVDSACFIKYADGKPVGFAECQLRRDYVEGAETSPVGYLEGIFVLEGYRQRGYAKELLARCESWAGEKGCSEFASDCELDNDASFSFHLAVGFEEANRIICFTKKLKKPRGIEE